MKVGRNTFITVVFYHKWIVKADFERKKGVQTDSKLVRLSLVFASDLVEGRDQCRGGIVTSKSAQVNFWNIGPKFAADNSYGRLFLLESFGIQHSAL